jgi:hypothetical protein
LKRASGDSPSKSERSEEVSLEVSGEDDGLERVVHSEVWSCASVSLWAGGRRGRLTKTTVDNDSDDGGEESTVETGNTIGGDGLLVDIQQTVELTLSGGSLLGGLVVVGETGSGVVEGVDEEEGGGSGGGSGGKVTSHPHGVAILSLGVGEEGLVVVLEGAEGERRQYQRTDGDTLNSQVKGLGREVTDDVGGVSTPDCGGRRR